MWYVYFFFNDTATTEIYTLSLHDALPISLRRSGRGCGGGVRIGVCGRGLRRPSLRRGRRRRRGRPRVGGRRGRRRASEDRKSTRLNSSHANISYAVFCLKKKKTALYPSFT